MNYINTYENFFKKVLGIVPKEVSKFYDTILNLCENNYEHIYRHEHKAKVKKTRSFSIYQDTEKIGVTQGHMFTGMYLILKVDYTPDHDFLMFAIIDKPVDNDIKMFQNFLFFTLKPFSFDHRGYIDTMKKGDRLWIKLDKIKDAIKELTKEKLDIYLEMEKYNL